MHKKRIRQSPKLPAGERRGQLLEAAHELFLKQGYRATTIDQIAKEAGLTKGAVYFHFATKEDILMAFVQEIIDGHQAALGSLAGRRLAPAQLLLELHRIDCQMPLPEARRNLTLLAEVIMIPRFRKKINTAYERSVEAMADCLDPAYGRTRGERLRMIELVHALYDGINFAGLIHPEIGNFHRQVETFAKATCPQTKRNRKKQ